VKRGDDPAIREIASEDELQQAVLEARRRGQRIRALGSGGSKSDVTSVPGEAVRLVTPNRLLDVADGIVRAPAGVTTAELLTLLRNERLTLPTVGEWKNATLAGALATATHGGSARHGITATSVRSFRIVTGTGELKRVGRDDPDFTHLAVSLGAFGIISEVELACDEHFSLEMTTDVVPFEEYVADPVAQESRVEFHASIWVPAARRVIRFGAERIPTPSETLPRRTRFGQWTSMARFVARRLGFHGVVSNRFFGGVARGDCADILSPLDVPPRVARFRKRLNEIRRRRAAELAVPASRAAEALARFDPFFRKHDSTLNNPIGLRMSASDDFAISPCQGRDTLWMDIFFDASEPFEAGLSDLAAELDARCHWGKTLALSPEALRCRYPQWEEFRAARDRFDPDQVFANEFTDTLGLTSRAARA
jgi:FAD/FMN-containing dehydrogenase